MMKRLLVLLAMLGLVLVGAEGQLKIYFMDVNQGDATLVIAPGGKTLLIDAGEEADADEVLQVLNKEGITRIDYAVVTHFDADHVKGFGHLRQNNITFAHPIYTYTGGAKSHKAILETTDKMTPDMTIDLGSGVTATCLASHRKVSGGGRAKSLKSSNIKENQNSIALLVAYGGFEMFIAGDLTKHVEKVVSEAGVAPDVDLYHVSHHGSTTSTSQLLLDDLQAEVAIVSNGTKFNHPTATVVKRLRDMETVVYQTNKNTSNKTGKKNVDDAFIGDLDPTKDEGTILVEVRQANYTVSLERKGYANGTTYPIDQ